MLFYKSFIMCEDIRMWIWCPRSQEDHWSPGVGFRAVVNHLVCELGTILASSASAVWTLNPWAIISLVPLFASWLTDLESRPRLLYYLRAALSRITPCVSVSLPTLSSPLPSPLPSCTPPPFLPLHFSLVLVWVVLSVCFYVFCLP